MRDSVRARHFALIEKSLAITNQRLACNLSGGTQSDPTISPVATSIMITTSNSLHRERDAQSHVQQKAEVFSGTKPTRVKVRPPVARIACAEETKRMESIDKAIF